ncbi:MAG: glucose-1-phosphate adenylyltransferase [Armatimonadetes bacterium]|nr:glucose-1-phosphate adenylyltransferase [Armatimonadota bacterium]MDI9586056.1 glucose-1-phosphate adenylyltransferase [Acidobacteriota bacterium]
MGRINCIILGGGRGTRLHPLTRDRAKPAVPLAGKYRLIDIPVSNCLNSGLNRVYVLTQFNTASLHRHIMHTYKFDDFGGGFVEILAAEQTVENPDWYQGTADAVRQNLRHLNLEGADLCVILSGDQLYRMDLMRMIAHHRDCCAEITIATIPVAREEAGALGVLKVGADYRIGSFFEKPDTEEALDAMTIAPQDFHAVGLDPGRRTHLASMGIYVFNAEVLLRALEESDADDFGKQIIPDAIQREGSRVFAFPFDGYWEDIGTIPAFFKANLALTDPVPPFDMFDEDRPIWTHPRYLPPCKLNRCDATGVIIGDGTVIEQSRLKRCVIGLRSIVREGCDLDNVVMMGADFYETPEHYGRHRAQGLPPIGLGKNVKVRNAIIDKNARIGDGCEILNRDGILERDGDDYCVREGIVIIPRSGVMQPGTVI